MRHDILFGFDGELYVCYYPARYRPDCASTSLWMIPGTHPDDPSSR